MHIARFITRPSGEFEMRSRSPGATLSRAADPKPALRILIKEHVAREIKDDGNSPAPLKIAGAILLVIDSPLSQSHGGRTS